LGDPTDKRQHNRVTHRSDVRVTDAQGSEHIAHTRDLSHGGLFVCISADELPEFGSKVTVQALDIEDAMVNRAVVVRVEAGAGIAIEFLDD
jgi:hypothetical protein